MTEFRLKEKIIGRYVGLGRETFSVYFSIGALSPGDVVAPKLAAREEWVILAGPHPTQMGWMYEVERTDPDMTAYLPTAWKIADTVFIKKRSHGYGGDDNEWGPAKPFEESLTPQQALRLAIETLENFRDEYSDVGPIIDKLKKAL